MATCTGLLYKLGDRQCSFCSDLRKYSLFAFPEDFPYKPFFTTYQDDATFHSKVH